MRPLYPVTAALLTIAGFSSSTATAESSSRPSQPRLRLVRTFKTRQGVNCIAFTPDSSRVLAGSWDSLWDDYDEKYSDDGYLAFWDLKTGAAKVKRQVKVPLMSVAYSPDGRTLATGYAGGLLRLSDSNTGRTLREIRLPDNDGIECLAFSPDGLTIACATFNSGECHSNPGPRYLVNTQNGQLRPPGYRGFFRELSMEYSREWFAVAPRFNRLMTWQEGITLKSPDEKHGIFLCAPEIDGLDVAATEGNIAAGMGYQGDIAVWDVASRKLLGTISNGVPDGSYRHIAVSPNGRYVAASSSGVIKVWKLVTPVPTH